MTNWLDDMETRSLDSLPSLRPLGLAEQYSTARSYLGIYTNVCVTATYSNKHGAYLKAALFRSLATVIAKHPILSAVPIEISGVPWFVRLQQIHLDQVVSLVEKTGYSPGSTADPTLDELLEAQHNSPFKQDNSLVPFWRISVLTNPEDGSWFTLCLCFHHSLVDTQSALILHEDLEHALAAAHTGPAPDIVQGCREVLVPPLESMVPLPVSPGFVRGQQHLGEPPRHWWSGKQQTLPVRTRFSSLWLSEALFSCLRRQCKENGVSLTAGLMALIAGAFFRILPPDYTVVQGDCAVSLRRFLPPTVDTRSVGCYVGSFSEVYNKDSSLSVWEDAKRTKNTIDEALQDRGADMPVGYLSRVPSMVQWLAGKLGKKRWAGWELSNVGGLGETPGLRRGDAQIRSVMFSQSASACSGAIKVSVASGRDGRLGLGFTWQDGVVEDELVKGLMRGLVGLTQEVTMQQ